MTLPRLTWEQALRRHVWPAAAFAALGVTPAAIRKRASRGALKPAALGPRGCKLYRYVDVFPRHANKAARDDSTAGMSH